MSIPLLQLEIENLEKNLKDAIQFLIYGKMKKINKNSINKREKKVKDLEKEIKELKQKIKDIESDKKTLKDKKKEHLEEMKERHKKMKEKDIKKIRQQNNRLIQKEKMKKFKSTFKAGKKRKPKVLHQRRHKGINQQTGRLKKGYKYSDKTLKSGLKKIIQENKK